MKKLTAIIVVFATVLCLSSCINNEAINYNAGIAADTLNSSLSFGETLEKSTAAAAYTIYGIDSSLCTDAAIYVGSGATADEVAVFNCKDTQSAETVLDAVNLRLEYLKAGYGSYGPDQVPKIENAVVISTAETIIVCICENPEAVNGILESLN